MALQKLICCAVTCIFCLLLAVGCSQRDTNRSSITGEVKLDGKPLERGSILFTPIDGTKGSVAGGPIENGRYQLSSDKGPAVGQNRVEIRAIRKTGKMIQKPLAPKGQMIEESVEAIPPRYNSASTLKTEVKAGENTTNFEVASK